MSELVDWIRTNPASPNDDRAWNALRMPRNLWPTGDWFSQRRIVTDAADATVLPDMRSEGGVTGGIAVALYRNGHEGKQVLVRHFAHRDEWSLIEELLHDERQDAEMVAVSEVWKQAGLVVEDGELHDRMIVVEQFGFRRWPVQLFFMQIEAPQDVPPPVRTGCTGRTSGRCRWSRRMSRCLSKRWSVRMDGGRTC